MMCPRAAWHDLFRTPTGLADGLALKELARLLSRRFAPTTWVPRSTRPAWTRRAANVADWFRRGVMRNPAGSSSTCPADDVPHKHRCAARSVRAVNFARDVVDAADPGATALVAHRPRRQPRARSPSARSRTARRGWPAPCAARGVERGDVVMTLIGSRPEWVYAMVACFRIGAVALPCIEQLRPTTCGPAWTRPEPRCSCRRRAQRRHDPRGGLPRRAADGSRTSASSTRPPAPAADLAADDPALITFTSGTSGEPKPIRHGQRYLPGQRIQAEHWFGARRRRPRLVHRGGRLVEVRPQRLRRALAARRRGAAARRPLRPRRAARHRRARGRQRALHGADRVPRDRQAHRAAPAPRPAPCRRRRRAAEPRDRATVAARPWASRSTTATARPRPARSPGMPIGPPVRPGSMGKPLPGHRALDRGRRAVRGPVDRAHVLHRRPERARGTPATACARTRTATSGSRAAPTT